MSFENSETVAAYDMQEHATGLAVFIQREVVGAVPTHQQPVIYVIAPDGGQVTGARLVRVTLTDGSEVFNLHLSGEG